MENNFEENQTKGLKKNKNLRVKIPHVNKKPLAREGNLVQTKTRPRMKYEWVGKTI